MPTSTNQLTSQKFIIRRYRRKKKGESCTKWATTETTLVEKEEDGRILHTMGHNRNNTRKVW